MKVKDTPNKQKTNKAMNKEEILNQQHRVYTKELGTSVINPKDFPIAFKQAALNAMDEYARQQSVAFFKWNAVKISEYMDYLRSIDQAEGVTETELALNHFERTTIDGRYSQFIEQQTKDK